MKVEKLLSIISINYNGLKDTCELIDSLPLENASLEVIIVDNGSSKDEATELEKRYPQINVIRSSRNLGFAGGNNLGIQAAHGKYLLFLNNDTILKPQTSDLKPLIARLESSDEIGMVSPKIRFTWGNHPIQYAGYTPLSKITLRNQSIGCGEDDQGQYDTPHPTSYAHGAAMMVKQKVIDKVGMMPECYFLYYEELDWSEMIHRAGYEIWYEPACTIYHKESQTTGRQSPLKTYYITRNRLIFAKRNINKHLKFLTYIYLLSIVAIRDILKYVCKGRIDLIRATYRGVMDFIN